MGCHTRGLPTKEDENPTKTTEIKTNQRIRESKQVREIVFRKTRETTLTIPVKINGRAVKALVDTGAEISVISHELARTMKSPLKRELLVKLKGAETSSDMKGYRLEPVSLKVEKKEYPWRIYEADIQEQFILGLDFLQYHRAVIDLDKNIVRINESNVPAILRGDKEGPVYQVSRVKISKKTVIPPHSAGKVKCELSNQVPGLILCEVDEQYQGCLDETTLHQPKEDKIDLIYYNQTDRFITLKKDSPIGVVMEFDGPPIEIEREEDNQSDENRFEVRNVKLEHDESLPEHLTDLYNRATKDLSSEEKQQVHSLLVEYQDIFAKDDLDIGCFTALKHQIDTGEEEPVKHRLRRTPLGFEKEEKEYIQKMLDAGVIRPSISEWASSPVLIRKKDKTVRYCLDYRDLNNKTRNVGCNWPLPSIDDCLDTLSGSQYFSTIDLAAGYWQIMVEEEDIPKTAWISKYGHFENLRMPFGLKGAPSTMQRAIEYTLRGLLWLIAIGYLDDVITKGLSFLDHLQNLRKVFQRFRENHLKIKPKKCQLFQTEVIFLGRKVTPKGITVDPSKVEAIKDWKVPTTTKELERFIGFINYHREFIPNISARCQNLFKLKGQKSFQWEDIHQAEFEDLKTALISPPVLGYPDPNAEFILDTDASDTNIAAILYQVKDETMTVISYGSLMLSAEQRNYCTTRKELLAVVRFTRQYRHYLLGKQFTLRTDNASLLWVMKFRNLTGQLARWVEELNQYSIKMVHRAGRLHTNADVLSRLPTEPQSCPEYKSHVPLSELPCGGCKYCQRVNKKWSQFEEDVDYVVPLSVKTLSKEPGERDSARWINQFSSVALHQMQKKDPNLAPILKWLEDEEPREDQLLLSSPATKHYWQHRNLLSIRDTVLYYKWICPGGDSKWLLVVPKDLKESVLLYCHDNILAGHMGMDKTKERVKRNCYWFHVNQECEEYVKSCSTCNTSKKSQQKGKASMRLYHAGAPMEKVHIDILGPLTTTTKGNKYVFVMIDQFTKWIELEALSDQTAESVAKSLVDSFISRFGTPKMIISDQGANFVSQLFLSVCELLQVAKKRTSPYRPSANGQVERSNRTILQLLRSYVQNHHKWDQDLQQLAGAIRSTIHRQTGFTPNKMMLGREVQGPLELMIGTEVASDENEGTYVQELSSALEQTHELARRSLQNAQMRQKREYDANSKQLSYEPGDLVYEINSASKIGISQKLQKIWKGPLLVVKVLSPWLYVVKGRRKERVVHHDRLKVCRDREIPLWMMRMRNDFFKAEQQGEVWEREEDYGEETLGLEKLFQECVPTRGRREKETQGDEIRDIPEVLPEVPKITQRGRRVNKPSHLRNDYIC